MFELVDPRRLLLAAPIGLLLLIGGCGGSETDMGASSDASATTAQQATAADNPEGSDGAYRSVDSETLPYAEVDDELVYGHFAFPSDMIEPLPAVIVVHDWWGLNDDTRAAANQLAAEGYMVLAVDLYGGETADRAEEARVKMISVVENPQLVEDNIRQALEFVSFAGAPGKATLGWGFGGGWALNVATLFPEELDAAVIYYGQVITDEARLQAINAPVLGLFGERDRSVKLDTVRQFEAAMERLQKEFSIHVYPDNGHAFADPARGSYDAATTENAWQRTVEFLAASLADNEES